MRVIKLLAYVALAIALPFWFFLSDEQSSDKDNEININGLLKIMAESQNESKNDSVYENIYKLNNQALIQIVKELGNQPNPPDYTKSFTDLTNVIRENSGNSKEINVNIPSINLNTSPTEIRKPNDNVYDQQSYHNAKTPRDSKNFPEYDILKSGFLEPFKINLSEIKKFIFFDSVQNGKENQVNNYFYIVLKNKSNENVEVTFHPFETPEVSSSQPSDGTSNLTTAAAVSKMDIKSIISPLTANIGPNSSQIFKIIKDTTIMNLQIKVAFNGLFEKTRTIPLLIY